MTETVAPTPGSARLYVCPMDPEVVSDRPGPCPKCGMALEPKDVLPVAEADPEQIDMLRRFWVGLALTIPVMVLAMGEMLVGHGNWIAPWPNGLIQLALTS